MNVSMRLTLSDLASGPLKEFVGQLDLLSAKITSLNAKFTSFSSVSREFNASNQTSSASLTGLNSRVDALVAGLSSLTAKLTSSVSAMESLAPASNAAAIGLQNTTRSLDGVAGSASRAKDSIRGLVEAYGALKIAQGLKSAVGAGSDYQATQTRLANLNVPGANASIERAANQAAQSVPQMSREQTLSMGIDLVNATGSVAHAVEMLKPFAQAMFNMKMAMPTGKRFTENDMLSVAKALEQRGVTMNPAAMQTELDYVSKIVAATQGRVGPQQLLGNINYSKGGLGLTMEDKFLPIFASLIERQGTGSGGHGGQVGTALTSLQQAIVGGVIKQSALIDWSKMGLLDPSKLVFTSTGALKGVQAGGVAGSSLFMKNPYEWVQQYLVPALKRTGVNTSDHAAVNESIAHLFQNRNAANIVSVMATQQPLLEKDAKIINETKSNQEQYAANAKTAKANFIEFHAALSNLSIAMGTSVIPEVTKLTNAIASLIEKVSEFAQKNPEVTKSVTELGAAIGVIMGIKAASWFLRLIGVIGKLGPKSSEAATAVKGSASAMSSAWKTRLLAMGGMALRFAGVVGTAFLLYQASANIDIAGVSLQDRFKAVLQNMEGYVAQSMAWIAGKIADAFDAVHALKQYAKEEVVKAVGHTGMGANLMRGFTGDYLNPNTGKYQIYDSKTTNTARKIQEALNTTSDDYFSWANKSQNTAFGSREAAAAKAAADKAKTDEEFSNAVAAEEAINQASPKTGRSFGPIPSGMSGSHLKLSPAERERERASAKQARELDKAMNFYQSQMAHGDAIQQIKNKFAPNIATLQSVGLTGLASQLQGQEQKQIGKANIDIAKKHLKDLQDALSGQQTQNAALVTAGVLTPDQAQAKTIADQKAAAPELLKAAEAVRAYEKAMGESTTKIDTTITKLRALGDGLTQLQQKISNAVQGAFSTFFEQLMGGKTSWKDMGKKFVENILNGVNQAVSQNLSQSLIKGLFGSGTKMGQGLRSMGGSDSLMSGIGSWIGNLFGGSGSTAAPKATASTGSSASSGWMSALGSIVGSVLSSFAVGADNIPHDMVAQIHKGEMIIPAAGAEAIRSGKMGGGSSPNINFTIHAMDSQSVLGAMSGIQRELATMLAGTNANLNLGG